MILATYTKQPAEVKDYDVDYLPWLTPPSDTIDNVETAVVCMTDPLDTALAVDRTANTATLVKLWITGGTANAKYKVTIKISTPAGRVDESELIFKIKDY